jgi:MOSC domain-containing protein YiiM
MTRQGTVVSIHIAPVGAAPMMSVANAQVVVGRGLERDRYYSKLGTYSNQPGSGRDVTLIEIEAIQSLKRDYEIQLDPGQSRRNIVTRGIALNHLVEQQFRVGDAILRGTRLCEPCAHMEKLTVKGALRGLIHRGGLRAEVVKGGAIRIGDRIVAEDHP